MAYAYKTNKTLTFLFFFSKYSRQKSGCDINDCFPSKKKGGGTNPNPVISVLLESIFPFEVLLYTRKHIDNISNQANI